MKLLFKVLGGLVSLFILAVIVFYTKFSNISGENFAQKSYTFNISKEVENGDVTLGKRIYAVRNGCIDCHGKDLAGKMVMDNPAMGTIKAANITPFILKDWSNEEIARAIRYGVHKSGRSLRFMPSFDYVKLSKSDIGSLIAYLRSVPEVKKPNKENYFGPVVRIMSTLGKMPVVFPAKFIDQTLGFAVKPAEAATTEFGEYLAASCVGCHGDNFEGGPIPGGDPAWPEAPNIRFGANSYWTEDHFRSMIKTGISPSTGEDLRAPMPINLLQEFNEMELSALYMYLSSLK